MLNDFREFKEQAIALRRQQREKKSIYIYILIKVTRKLSLLLIRLHQSVNRTLFASIQGTSN